MASQIVYGVDTSQEVTPIMVRDAIIRCFLLAHKKTSVKLDGIRVSNQMKNLSA
jgi:hypothetical protein